MNKNASGTNEFGHNDIAADDLSEDENLNEDEGSTEDYNNTNLVLLLQQMYNWKSLPFPTLIQDLFKRRVQTLLVDELLTVGIYGNELEKKKQSIDAMLLS